MAGHQGYALGPTDEQDSVFGTIMHNAAPSAIMLHLGSNDIGSVRCNVLLQVFRQDILAKMFPTAVLLVSAMLPRMAWFASISRD